MMAAIGPALAAGAAEAWRMRSQKGRWVEKAPRVATAAAGAAAIAAFKNGGDDGGREDRWSRDRYDDRYDDRRGRKEEEDSGFSKGSMLKSMVGGLIMNRFAHGSRK
ncbi:uncharacterized protein VDAG_02237 [Verticillium dahliae VdLs.17]|uniref:Uncharacterized protein n=2 Tax=Verticillium dahliae TaxID=27337 RepID=G2WV96_VERDV|nr:uncharacterized protein VDAG_02237 [Verticillium dahliae VdLs.17]EGY20221.1 hypothetical protein VDAG_02237 [Verticillium dahliae VdLs.17]